MVPIPRLTKDQHRLLVELEVLGFAAPRRGVTRLLRWLIRHRCIEVMGVSPARYRVTRLGRVARGLGVRR